jgi:MFS family permease
MSLTEGRIPAHLSLWQDRSFVLMFASRSVSVAGTAITTVALPLIAYQLTGSALQTSLVSAINVVPYLIFGLVSGAIADRADRRKMMVIADLACMLCLASIPIAAAMNLISLVQLYIVQFLVATGFVWFDGANFGALPNLVGRSRLVEANSLLFSTTHAARIIAPSVGGVLAAWLGAANTISFNVISFLLSAVALSLIPRAFNSARNQHSTHSTPLLADIREGVQFIRQHRFVRTLTLLGIGLSVSGGAIDGLTIVHAVEVLGLPEHDPRIGWIFTAGAIGSLMASLMLPRIARRFGVGKVTLISLFCVAVSQIGVAYLTLFPFALIIRVVWSWFQYLVVVNGISLRQMVTPMALQGRVNAVARMVAWGGSPFGAAIGGIIAENFGVQNSIAVMVLAVCISAVAGLFSDLRKSEVEFQIQSN